MTETQWFVCDDPRQMIQFLSHARWSERQARLFAVACCRQLPKLPDDRLQRAIETSERFADSQVDDVGLCNVMRIARDVVEWEARHDMASSQSHAAEVVAATVQYPTEDYTAVDELIAWARAEHSTPSDARAIEDALRRTLTSFVRDIASNPFRPVTFTSEWRTDAAVTLARQMYESRDFSAMPILADALQDAGCNNDDMLNHCRDINQVHVRGCWVVDTVLGK
jgi:hypothetical protein